MTKTMTDKRLHELATGRVTVRELTTYQPRLKTFRTRYAAQCRGTLLRTKRGLRFATRQAALVAGRECIRQLNARLVPNGEVSGAAAPLTNATPSTRTRQRSLD
jgi:hypothetical protein